MQRAEGLHQVCGIENELLDSQASIWVDLKLRQVSLFSVQSRHLYFILQLVISFRGTEQIKLQDILTDINLVQVIHGIIDCICNQTLSF